MSQTTHLDSAESVFFKRQNEHIEKRVYEKIYPEHKSRVLLPPIAGVPDSAPVYTWRMYDKVGDAAIVASMAGDLPRADALGSESSQVIKTVGASYAWDILELKEASRTNTPLNEMKAMAARYQIERKIDTILAVGDSIGGTFWCRGLLNQLNTTTYTLANKAGGGKTWAVATADEIAKDIFGIVSNLIDTLQDAGGAVFHKFTVVIPVEQFNLISQKRMGDGSDKTVLRFVLDNSPFIASIEPWYRCNSAGSGSTDRMVAYVKDPMVVGALVPMEYQTQPPEQRNLTYVINAMARVGGVISPYPLAISYGDGL